MDLENLGLVELNIDDSSSINGGQTSSWLPKIGLAYLAQQVIDNWVDIKKGVIAGFNTTHKLN